MRVFKNFFLFSIIFFLSFSLAFSSEKTAFLDLDILMKETIAGKKIIENLSILNENNISLLNSKENKIKKLENDINKKKNIVSEEETKSKIKTLKNEISIFRKEKDKLVKEFNDKKSNDLNNFFKQANPIIQEYIAKNDISIVFDKKNIFIANQDNNITNDIVILLNRKLK